jgi:hypothetical protein
MGHIDELVPLLKKLRLSGVLQSLELRLREAADDSPSYDESLYRLVKTKSNDAMQSSSISECAERTSSTRRRSRTSTSISTHRSQRKGHSTLPLADFSNAERTCCCLGRRALERATSRKPWDIAHAEPASACGTPPPRTCCRGSFVP